MSARRSRPTCKWWRLRRRARLPILAGIALLFAGACVSSQGGAGLSSRQAPPTSQVGTAQVLAQLQGEVAAYHREVNDSSTRNYDESTLRIDALFRGLVGLALALPFGYVVGKLAWKAAGATFGKAIRWRRARRYEKAKG